MPNFARLGDKVSCPKCGAQTIVSASPTAKIKGVPIARVGDQISCGSIITTGSDLVKVDGKPVALIGSKTSHGGVVLENGLTVSTKS
ncbi:MAG: PAAR domain-containing protein [Deltaproteobacteria bacterium]|jgi:uncharacterized Zn-binding protein involved in type VI secretion|nr:PAAR domain-containing protein [Deltaproteobacteria bacterium]